MVYWVFCQVRWSRLLKTISRPCSSRQPAPSSYTEERARRKDASQTSRSKWASPEWNIWNAQRGPFRSYPSTTWRWSFWNGVFRWRGNYSHPSLYTIAKFKPNRQEKCIEGVTKNNLYYRIKLLEFLSNLSVCNFSVLYYLKVGNFKELKLQMNLQNE